MSNKWKLWLIPIFLVACSLMFVFGYRMGLDQYASHNIRFDEDNQYLQWGEYRISAVPNDDSSCVFFSKISMDTGNERTFLILKPDGTIAYQGKGLQGNMCTSDFNTETGSFVSGSYVHHTPEGFLKCIYSDDDADGLWDVWMVYDNSENPSISGLHRYRRDGLSWVEIYPQDQKNENVSNDRVP